MKVATEVVLAEEQRTILERRPRGRSAPARLVLRSQIVLLAAEGKMNQKIAAPARGGWKETQNAPVGVLRNRSEQIADHGIVVNEGVGGMPMGNAGRLQYEKPVVGASPFLHPDHDPDGDALNPFDLVGREPICRDPS